jgi:hypothetical protein
MWWQHKWGGVGKKERRRKSGLAGGTSSGAAVIQGAQGGPASKILQVIVDRI